MTENAFAGYGVWSRNDNVGKELGQYLYVLWGHPSGPSLEYRVNAKNVGGWWEEQWITVLYSVDAA